MRLVGRPLELYVNAGDIGDPRRQALHRAVANVGVHPLYRRAVDGDATERQLNLHLDPDHLAGVYANYATVTFSDYEFTITFARIEYEVEGPEVPGAVVARVNMSTRFTRELLDALADSWSKWSSRETIRNLPEAPRPE